MVPSPGPCALQALCSSPSSQRRALILPGSARPAAPHRIHTRFPWALLLSRPQGSVSCADPAVLELLPEFKTEMDKMEGLVAKVGGPGPSLRAARGWHGGGRAELHVAARRAETTATTRLAWLAILLPTRLRPTPLQCALKFDSLPFIPPEPYIVIRWVGGRPAGGAARPRCPPGGAVPLSTCCLPACLRVWLLPGALTRLLPPSCRTDYTTYALVRGAKDRSFVQVRALGTMTAQKLGVI